ncbi:hypothetical protein PHMEG_0008128 [Phytophthora megakarya]|uniref:Uncharacterized protein n=1 Tax=Phytophthora megakarya TaxID=4795 RepID=A0A225WM00_9STRA|nr:hypothetical protein PHMEG_0008128 [Phytophthora megakarya]
MNSWTKAECKQLADAMGIQGNGDLLWRYNFVEGKPRFLFSSEHFDGIVKCLQKVIRHKLEDLEKMIARFNQ